MGLQDLQAFLESPALEGGAVSVDLLKIARNIMHQRPTNRKMRQPMGGNKLRLVIDAENCLDRLYGGYYSDWACGGQWNRMYQFLSLLTEAIEHGNIEFTAVFNGSVENSRMDEWIAEQATVRQRVGMVLKHISTKATPPPKIWWTAPICLRTALRMALRHLGITVMCTTVDHHQEVMAYCQEFDFHGLLADDAEYAVLDPSRYFSSEHLKLTYKGSLETKEYMVSVMAKHLQLQTDQLCILAALLGNFLMPEAELQDIHKRVLSKFGKDDEKMQGETAIKLLAEYVRTLPSVQDLDALAVAVFGENSQRGHIFKHSVSYYLNGKRLGFLNGKNNNSHSTNYRGKNLKSTTPPKVEKISEVVETMVETPTNNVTIKEEVVETVELDTSGFASETTEQEQESLKNYNLATVNQILASASDIISADQAEVVTCEDSPPTSDTSRFNGHSNGGTGLVSSPTNSSAQDSPLAEPVSPEAPPLIPITPASSNSNCAPIQNNQSVINVNVSSEVLRTATSRHQKGLMTPWLLHVLTTKEVRLPCVMEDEANREFPPVHEIYQPLRQRVYAVLFNLHHHRYVHAKKKEAKEVPDNAPPPEVVVKEWAYSRSNPYQHAEEVKAVPLPWAVPTLHRLWFGSAVDDKRRRMRALLSCLSADTPLILNTAYVPQHMLVMACVLRYIMSLEKAILRRAELDVFLAQAFIPDLMNTQYLQELTLNVVTSRGVQLAAVFMQGVEMTLLANDACGAPLPWLMCCPWLYFDGKLFHHTLTRATQAKTLLDLCENHIDRVVKVERMRKAILEGLDPKFAKVPLQHFTGHIRGMPPPNCLPAMALPSTRGSGSHRHRPIQSRGGQLQIAGVVVGSWGANYGYQNSRQQNPQQMHLGGGGGNGNNAGGYQNNRNGRSAPQGNYHQQQQQQGTQHHQHQQYNHSQPRGGGSGGVTGGGPNSYRPRKTGPPTYPVGHKKNTVWFQ